MVKTLGHTERSPPWIEGLSVLMNAAAAITLLAAMGYDEEKDMEAWIRLYIGCLLSLLGICVGITLSRSVVITSS